uniref:Uncharacterized protein n=1 Tax=Anguilla anguilla TaxID=7936 RepID=A0A0E9P8R7_ANGAN
MALFSVWEGVGMATEPVVWDQIPDAKKPRYSKAKTQGSFRN